MAEPEQESLKKHGDELGTVASENDGRPAQAAGPNQATRDPIPMPENGGHEKSHAAHLGHVHAETKPADKLRQGMEANTLREPPMVVSRVGKQNRG